MPSIETFPIYDDVDIPNIETFPMDQSDEMDNIIFIDGTVDDIFNKGKTVLDNFNIDNAYVKPKHLSTTKGKGQQFLGNTKIEAEEILKDAIRSGTVKSITDNGLTRAGNASYEIIIDAGNIVGTRGETLIKIVLSEDGGMLSAYPIK
ncbi:hypothetical protein [Clostridium sp. ZBS13]|uniref:hypothetical protein n=1 Tax=Clostridium sp. ZBS13 TaxID=2949971 RepID=UPI00207A66EA|nr:hypothetical protein [Clostridium sp. ZBS13]